LLRKRLNPKPLTSSASPLDHVITANEAHAFDVYERRPIEMAPHDGADRQSA